MPIVDMPVKELFTYQGVNPKPKDHDAYWQRALDEMHALGTEYELVEADFKARRVMCYDLYFTGVGGARVHAKLLRPKVIREKLSAVLMFHGYTGNCGDWSSKLNYAEHMVVAALDARGQGGLSEDVGGVVGNTHNGHIIRGLDEDNPDKQLFRNIFLDTAQLARIVMAFPEVDAARVGTMGGSQGGALSLACAALEPRIARAAPMYPFLCDYKRVWDMDLDKAAYVELRTYFRLFDPRHEREHTVFEKLGYIDIQFLAPRIKANVLMGTGLMDEICPPSSQFAAYNKITSEKEVLFYPDFGHEDLPGFQDRTFQFMSQL